MKPGRPRTRPARRGARQESTRTTRRDGPSARAASDEASAQAALTEIVLGLAQVFGAVRAACGCVVIPLARTCRLHRGR